jgi:23S rRNA pseudouridine1911/1915/1917 synthase
MELTYKIKKPENIKDFCHANKIPLKLIVVENNEQKIVVNNDRKTRNDSVRKGDTLRIWIPDEDYDDAIAPEAIPLNIVYEDDYVLIVDKPHGMPLMVTKNNESHTLANALTHYYMENKIQSKIHLVNRLDIDASGLVLVAKNRFIKFLLSEIPIKREYFAIIDGIVPNKTLSIDLPIGKQQDDSPKREVTADGEEAITEFTVIKEFKVQSLVQILNETGKTHQIRVHFAHFGFPLVGDHIYNPKYKTGEHLMLYMHHIAFKHPINGKDIDVIRELPNDLKQYLASRGGL